MKLHKIQRKILDLFNENHEYTTKTLRDIGEAVGEGRDQPQKIRHHINQLENKGYIKVDPVSGYVSVSNSPFNIVNIPLYAIASCGDEGLFDQENLIEEVPLPSKSFGISDPEDYFLAKAIGNSMEPLIQEDDLVLSKYQKNFSGLGVYVVVHNNLPKIKRVKEKDGIYFLFSENPNYKPVRVLESDDFFIEGIVKSKISHIGLG